MDTRQARGDVRGRHPGPGADHRRTVRRGRAARRPGRVRRGLRRPGTQVPRPGRALPRREPPRLRRHHRVRRQRHGGRRPGGRRAAAAEHRAVARRVGRGAVARGGRPGHRADGTGRARGGVLRHPVRDAGADPADAQLRGHPARPGRGFRRLSGPRGAHGARPPGRGPGLVRRRTPARRRGVGPDRRGSGPTRLQGRAVADERDALGHRDSRTGRP